MKPKLRGIWPSVAPVGFLLDGGLSCGAQVVILPRSAWTADTHRLGNQGKKPGKEEIADGLDKGQGGCPVDRHDDLPHGAT